MLQFFNTLTRQKEEFHPMEANTVKMYTCGPTVYNFATIGNFRAYIFEDLLRRTLKAKGFQVTQIMNLTDVDDKSIRASREANLPLKEYTAKYIAAFFEDLDALHIERAERYPAATEHVPEMITLIETLLDKGIAYHSNESIYYNIARFPEYGKLAHLDFDNLQSGARIDNDEYNKESAHDFALWKAWTPEDGDVFWETFLGKGRPGWHIECSAMAMKYLGNHFDIHTGGVDNMFPHHENEIAQSEAATGEKFVNYWMHNEHLLVENKKMSKSLGNFYTLRDLMERGYSPLAIRYLLLSTHYRQQLNFTFAGLEAATNAIKRLQEFVKNLQAVQNEQAAHSDIAALLQKAEQEWWQGLDDDLNISPALAAVFNVVKTGNLLLGQEKLGKEDAQAILEWLKEKNQVLAVLDFAQSDIPESVLQLVQARDEARQNKDWAASDQIRDQLIAQGYIVKDTKQGTQITLK